MNDASIPEPVIRRLSLYLRHVEQLAGREIETVSSTQLGEALHVTAAQVRKDLAYFGHFGRPGVGYRVGALLAALRGVLGTDRTWNVVLVGVGNLGSALLRYKGFPRRGFRFVAAFDADPAKRGRRVGGVDVFAMDALPHVADERGAELGLIAVPAEAAQEVADRLCAVGLRGILNFAPATLTLPPNVPVDPVDLAAHLERIAFRAARAFDVDRSGPGC
ncbi:MAG: redox-sensing transcriptional repressor Rex [Phycisphaerae bacterium]|nr:redox-sensing transcriptional repressor Rex [Phycisphaerae bacterium]